MFYLQKVIAIIENSRYRVSMDKLAETLEKQGIIWQCFWIEELGLQEITGESVIDAIREKDGTCLWFTDIPDMVTVLRRMEQPVLALLHENNRNQDLSAALYACEKPEDLDGDYLDKVYRRYQRIPWEILRTDRCYLRETTTDDAEAFFEIYKEPSITRYTEGLYPEIEQERQYIRDYIDKVYSFYGFGVWTVIKQDTGEIIGRAGLSYREGFEEPEIGFVIGVPWQRQGYAEEVCRAIMEYGRNELEFTTVQAFVRPENEASLGLCKKLGMKNVEEVLLNGVAHCRMMEGLEG